MAIGASEAGRMPIRGFCLIVIRIKGRTNKTKKLTPSKRPTTSEALLSNCQRISQPESPAPVCRP